MQISKREFVKTLVLADVVSGLAAADGVAPRDLGYARLRKELEKLLVYL